MAKKVCPLITKWTYFCADRAVKAWNCSGTFMLCKLAIFHAAK